MTNKTLKIGLVSVSDRASQGVYTDQGLPELKAWLAKALVSPWEAIERLIPDEQGLIESTHGYQYKGNSDMNDDETSKNCVRTSRSEAPFQNSRCI